jgi:predicted Zn-dependent protease
MLDPARKERRAVAAVMAGALAAVAAAAVDQGGPQADLPADAVVAEVPARARDPLLAEIARQTREVRTAVDTRLARLAIEAARRRADPRYLGRAEAALGSAWQATDPPDEALLLRATVKQARHDFGGALADLERLIARAPENVQAQLTRAVVLTVMGRYREALSSCDALAGRAPVLVGLTCRAPALAATGGDATEEIERRLGRGGPDGWAQGVVGELRFWAGDRGAAERHLRAAIGVDPGDRYTRGVYADLLLDAGRGGEVQALLAGQTDDASLVRLAIAGRGGEGRSQAGTGTAVEELRARFAAARDRGDTLHAREQARFALAIEGDAETALRLALESWRVQHEPWDARLVLEAGRAVRSMTPGQRAAVAAVAAFVADRGAAWRAVDGGAR